MFLETTSNEKRSQMVAIAMEHQKLLLLINDDLSSKIISKLAEAFKKR